MCARGFTDHPLTPAQVVKIEQAALRKLGRRLQP